MSEEYNRDIPDDVREARASITALLYGLRYGAAVSARMPSADDRVSEGEYLDRLVMWLAAFSQVLAGVADTTAEMSEELNTLRSQRKAVREFLGIGKAAGQDGNL